MSVKIQMAIESLHNLVGVRKPNDAQFKAGTSSVLTLLEEFLIGQQRLVTAVEAMAARPVGGELGYVDSSYKPFRDIVEAHEGMESVARQWAFLRGYNTGIVTDFAGQAIAKWESLDGGRYWWRVAADPIGTWRGPFNSLTETLADCHASLGK